MRIHKITTILLSLCLSAVSFAQGAFPILEWSPEYNSREAKFDRLLDVGGDQFFTYRPSQFGLIASSREEFFALYNREDLSEEWLVKVPRWEYLGNKVDYKQSFMIDDVQYVFYESYDRQRDTRYLLCRTMDTLANLSEPVVVEQFDSRRRARGSFEVQLSKDRSKFAVFTNPPFQRNEAENFFIRIFNPALEEIWNADVALEYDDENVFIEDFEISNDGDVYILSYFDANPNRVMLSRDRREFFVLKVEGGEENQVIQYDLGLSNIRIQNIGIECDLQDGQMAISGFYGKQNFYTMDGAFYLLFNQADGEVVSTNLNVFSSEFVAQFNRYRAKRGKGLRENFVFRQFLARPDGGSYVIAEDYEVITRTVQTSRGTTVTNYYYYYNDIIVLSIGKDGTIDWYAHVPKKQMSMNDGGYFLGYLLLMNEEGLHFVYNDHKKNAKRWGDKPLRTLTNVKNSNLAMVSLTHDAELTYRILNKGKRQKFRVVPRSSRAGNEGLDGAVLLSLRGARIRFGNLYFEE